MLALVTALLVAARRSPRPPRLSATTVAPTTPGALLATASGAWPWILAALVLLVLVAVGVTLLLVARRRRRRRRRRALAPRFPIVLAHGLMGFDQIGVGPVRRHYFNGVPARLALEGCEVHRPTVAKSASVAQRAQQLAEQVRGIRATRVTIVAHSMGGLDARYAISRLGLGKKVAALVTIGTPHLGTPLADLGTELGGKLRLDRALRRLAVDLDAFYDLTSLRMEAFNREIQDVRGVEYASIVGVVRVKRHVNPLLLPTWLYLLERGGPSDGVVPAGSQRWGEVLAEIEADHWAQIGWGRAAVARELYQGLVRELRGRGL